MSCYKKIRILLFFCVGICSFSACRQQSKENGADEKAATTASAGSTAAGRTQVELTEEQFKTLGVQLGLVTEKNLKNVVRANGYLKLPPQNRASISPYMGGVVKRILVREGQAVKKGQTLATLEHPDFIKMQEQYLTTRSNLAFLEQEYERQKTLHTENVSAGKTYQRTEADYATAKAQLASLERQLSMLGISFRELHRGSIAPVVPIKSPIGGFLSNISVNTGSFVQPGTQMFEVLDNHHLHVDLLVYEKDLFKVKDGQRVSFVLTNQGNREFSGEIFTVGKAFENDTKSIAVHAEIKDNDKLGLIPGMFVNALIDVGEQKVPAVPEQSVIRSGEQEYVFALKQHAEQRPYLFEMLEVKTGVREGGFVEIHFLQQPALPHPQIATDGAFFIYSKLKAESEGGAEE